MLPMTNAAAVLVAAVWGAAILAADGDGTPSLPPHRMVGPPFHRRPRRSAALPYGSPGTARPTAAARPPGRFVEAFGRCLFAWLFLYILYRNKVFFKA